MVEQEIKNAYFKTIHNKETLKECRQFINDLYCANSGENMKFLERVQYRLEPKSTQFEKDIHFLAEEAFNYKYENLVRSMNHKISESKWNNHELMRYFTPESVIQIGQKIENLCDLEKLNVIGKNYKCNIEEGKVFLIYIWTVYKPICKKQLSWLNEVFIRHNWDSSAKFISINTDKNREYAQKLIKILHCDQHMDNLYIDIVKFPNHPLLQVTNKYGYPATILVNNDGLIDLCGNLNDINLEATIETLLKRERKNKKTLEDNTYISKENMKKLKKICFDLNNNFKNYVHDINANHLYGATIKIYKTYVTNKANNFNDKNNKVAKKRTAELTYCAHESDMHYFDIIFKDMYGIKNLVINRTPIVTYEIPYNRSPICSICHSFCNKVYNDLFNDSDKNKKEEKQSMRKRSYAVNTNPNNISINNNNSNNKVINTSSNKSNVGSVGLVNKQRRTITNGGFYYVSDDDDDSSDDDIEDKNSFFAYYYCSECKETYCYKCGNEITDVTDTSKMHKHFLFYINTNNRFYMKYILPYNIDTSHELDFKYFFENAKTEKLEDIASHYQCKCDSCLSFPIRTVRWKCCNCISKNICDECKTSLENKDENYDEILWNMNHAGCDPLHHIFIKVLFDCFSY